MATTVAASPSEADSPDALEGYGSLVLEAVQLPLPVLDDAHPGPREQLRSPGVVQAYLEPDLRRVRRDRGLRIQRKVHVGERGEILLLRPLLGGAHLVLEALGEECERRFGPAEGLLVVQVEDRPLGPGRGRCGTGLFVGSLTRGAGFRGRVSGRLGRGRCLRGVSRRVDEPLDGPADLLCATRARVSLAGPASA